MSTNTLPLIHARVHNALASHAEHSACVYTSGDGANFEVYPSPIFGSSITDFSIVLPELGGARLAIQVCNIYTRHTIEQAPWPLAEVDLDPSYGVRIVDKAQDLIHSPHYERAAFIRTDGSLVVWGDDEEAVLSSWTEIIYLVQNRPGVAMPTSTVTATVASSQPGYIPNDGTNLEDFMVWGNSLPYLNELAFLPIPQFSPPPSPEPHGYSAVYPSWPIMPSEGSLGLALPPPNAPSPFSETATSASFTDSPSTADFETFLPVYPPLVYLGEEEEARSDIPLDFSAGGGTSAESSSAESPSQSSSQCTITPFAHATTHEGGEGEDGEGEEHEEVNFVPQPSIGVDANGGDHGAAATATDVVDHHHHMRIMSVSDAPVPVRVPKRSRSVAATGSAPARLTVPLPDVVESAQQLLGDEFYRSRKFLAIAPAPPLASGSGSSSSSSGSTPTPVAAPAPSFPSSPSTSAASLPSPSPASTSASTFTARSRRRAKYRRSGGGGTSSSGGGGRTRRHPCEYNCGKTFTRLQDQQRHSSTSCDASMNRSGVVCPECGAVLSRLDAAQRHWRGHGNPRCEPPDWVSSRAGGAASTSTS